MSRSSRKKPQVPKPKNQLDCCPCCSARLVLPIGPLDAHAVIVSDRPGEWDIKHGRPFVPQAPAGRVLYLELLRAGLCLDEFRVTNVWLHEPNGLCLDWHVAQLQAEITGRKAVLALGSVACRVLLGSNVMAESGITKRRQVLSDMVCLVGVGPNPTEALHGGVGEFRLALERFAQAYRRLK